jgi:hypothetical protein
MGAHKGRTQPRVRNVYKLNEEAREKIQGRVRKLVHEFGGASAFAYAHSINPKYIYRWTHLGIVPSSDTLIQLSKISNISIEWVLLGRGDRYHKGRKPKAVQAAA